ncbi:MAG: YihY/virulence factor BrkB family protein [Planctomycetota bacterium]|jgi:membrane protein
MITWAKAEWRHFRQTLKRCGNDDVGLLAASMAYYATFSFFPLLLLLVALLGFALGFSTGAQDAQQELLGLLAKNTSTGFAENVRIALAEIRTGAVVGGPLGLAALVLAAIAIFTTFERALDRVWDTRRRARGILAAVRNVLFRRFRAFLMFLGVGLLLFAVFMAQIVVAAARTFATDLPFDTAPWSLLAIPAGVVLNGLLFMVVYKVLPKARVPWSEALRGGMLAAVLWETSRHLLTLYLVARTYSAYGVVGSLIVLMLWVYLASIVLLLGAEYVRVLHDDRSEGTSSR